GVDELQARRELLRLHLVVELERAAEDDLALPGKGGLLGQVDTLDEKAVGDELELAVSSELMAGFEQPLGEEGDLELRGDGEILARLEAEGVRVLPLPEAA